MATDRLLAALVNAPDDVVLFLSDTDLNAVVQTEAGTFEALAVAGEPIAVPLTLARAFESEYGGGRVPGLRRLRTT